MGRLLRGTFKLAVIGAVIGGVAFAAKKLMGGLGPSPGSADSPREWPSLVPEPSASGTGPAGPAGSNGAEPVPAASGPGDADAAAPIIDEVPFSPAPAPETGPGEGKPSI